MGTIGLSSNRTDEYTALNIYKATFWDVKHNGVKRLRLEVRYASDVPKSELNVRKPSKKA